MKPTAPFQSLLLRGLLLALGGLAGLLRPSANPAARRLESESEAELPRESWLRYLRAAAEPETVAPIAPPRRPVTRIGLTAVVTALFCLGAAFTAAAGDRAAGLLEDSGIPAPETTTPEPGDVGAATGEATPPPAAPATNELDAEPSRPAPTTPPEGDATTPPTETAAPDEDAAIIRQAPAIPPPTGAPRSPTAAPKAASPKRRQARARRTRPPLIRPISIRKRSTTLELESSRLGASTVWLHRLLPDPTPPSRRLTEQFAHELAASAQAEHVDWSLALGVLRARGQLGAAPATRSQLDALGQALAQAGAREQPWAAALTATGDTATADSAVAIAHLNRALGLPALVHGLEWAKERLGARLLSDERVAIYDGGRADIESGRVDVRVLALIAYLTEEYGSIDVSCVISGHRLYARPGVVSAHVYGLAVDIAGLGGTSILGHQEPGGVTERAVRSILLLPPELRPRQVISLLGLGGPSFPQADHYNHIHVGF
jgi:hypothetical protein